MTDDNRILYTANMVVSTLSRKELLKTIVLLLAYYFRNEASIDTKNKKNVSMQSVLREKDYWKWKGEQK